jgi:hypothetical protein
VEAGLAVCIPGNVEPMAFLRMSRTSVSQPLIP